MNSVKLKYGKHGLEVPLPGGGGGSVFEAGNAPALSSPGAVLGERLASPSGSQGLGLLAEKASLACIVVSDKTRYFPYRELLPDILDVLREKNTDFFFLVAAGMHSPATREDAVEILGGETAGKYSVISHDASDAGSLSCLGRVPSGAPVWVNRNYLRADLRILTGFIEPHFMAGFSGGRKSICPGLCGAETIRFVHSAEILSSPLAKPGCLDGNPVHRAMSEAASLAGCDFIVNVTLNSSRAITGIFCGGMEEAFLEGARACREQSLFSFYEEFDAVVCSGGGYPLDRNFYQTVKGLVGVLEMVKPGGTVICASECSDGLGSEDFRELLYGMGSPGEFKSRIFSGDYFRADQWEVQELVKVLEKCRVKLYSENLSAGEMEACGVEPVRDLSGEITEAAAGGAQVAVVPGGPCSLAIRGGGAVGG